MHPSFNLLPPSFFCPSPCPSCLLSFLSLSLRTSHLSFHLFNFYLSPTCTASSFFSILLLFRLATQPFGYSYSPSPPPFPSNPTLRSHYILLTTYSSKPSFPILTLPIMIITSHQLREGLTQLLGFVLALNLSSLVTYLQNDKNGNRRHCSTVTLSFLLFDCLILVALD